MVWDEMTYYGVVWYEISWESHGIRWNVMVKYGMVWYDMGIATVFL